MGGRRGEGKEEEGGSRRKKQGVGSKAGQLVTFAAFSLHFSFRICVLLLGGGLALAGALLPGLGFEVSGFRIGDQGFGVEGWKDDTRVKRT
jgi:hypothetical protein